MKIDEFIKRVNETFYAEYSSKDNDIYIYRTEQNMIDENKTGDDTYYFMNVKLCEEKFSLFIDPDWVPDDVKGLSLLFNLLRELEETPVEKRFPEKKYRVRLKGLNSDNGHQYLSCRDVTGKIFACALREDLKQEFTMDEINAIANQPKFKSTLWLKDLLHDGLEEVEYDE